MPRVKRGTVRHANRKKLAKLTKGYFLNKSKLYRAMKGLPTRQAATPTAGGGSGSAISVGFGSFASGPRRAPMT